MEQRQAGGVNGLCVCVYVRVGYSQQARRWPVPALAMVPRRGAVCCFWRVLWLSTFFFPSPDDVSFRFTTVPIEFFVPFEGIEFEQRI